jgi:hypothetical protein
MQYPLPSVLTDALKILNGKGSIGSCDFQSQLQDMKEKKKLFESRLGWLR